jgi:hypothetical protein
MELLIFILQVALKAKYISAYSKNYYHYWQRTSCHNNEIAGVIRWACVQFLPCEGHLFESDPLLSIEVSGARNDWMSLDSSLLARVLLIMSFTFDEHLVKTKCQKHTVNLLQQCNYYFIDEYSSLKTLSFSFYYRFSCQTFSFEEWDLVTWLIPRHLHSNWQAHKI